MCIKYFVLNFLLLKTNPKTKSLYRQSIKTILEKKNFFFSFDNPFKLLKIVSSVYSYK